MTNAYSSTPLALAQSRGLFKAEDTQTPRTEIASSPIALPSAEWTRLHLLLGVCASGARRWFDSASPLLRERYQLALTQQLEPDTLGDYSLLHDPIEDDPQWQDAFAEVEEFLEFELELAEIEAGPYFSFFLWKEKARLLREEFGIEWFSPAQMNPFVRFV